MEYKINSLKIFFIVHNIFILTDVNFCWNFKK